MRLIRELPGNSRFVFYISLFLLGVILSVWLVVNRRNLQLCIASYKVRNRELSKVRALQARLENLREEKRLLESGIEENEIAVRNRFRMVKEGEHLVLVEYEDAGEKKTEKSD